MNVARCYRVTSRKKDKTSKKQSVCQVRVAFSFITPTRVEFLYSSVGINENVCLHFSVDLFLCSRTGTKNVDKRT